MYLNVSGRIGLISATFQEGPVHPDTFGYILRHPFTMYLDISASFRHLAGRLDTSRSIWIHVAGPLVTNESASFPATPTKAHIHIHALNLEPSTGI